MFFNKYDDYIKFSLIYRVFILNNNKCKEVKENKYLDFFISLIFNIY